MTEKTLPQSWWQALPHDFHRKVVGTDADAVHPLKVQGSAVVDVFLRTALATALAGTVLPLALSPGRLAREMERMAFYRGLLEPGATPDLERVFATPPPRVAIKELAASLLGYRPTGIPVRQLQFDSPYIALNPAVRGEYAQHQRNHRAVAQHWTHPDGPRPTLVFLHGFLADAYWINSVFFSLRWFWKQGFDILLVTLPFHGPRQSALSPFSGAGYFANGFSHTNEAMLQAVFDVRIWMNYLQSRGVPAMGISGVSLGGYLSAMTASVDDRLAFCIPNAPVVSPADMVMEWAPLSWFARISMRRFGMTVEDLRHASALHCPLTWQPRIAPERLLIIGGAGDRFTAPRYVRQLHRHWNGSRLHWFPGNHVMHLHQRDYLKLMRDFMRDCSG